MDPDNQNLSKKERYEARRENKSALAASLRRLRLVKRIVIWGAAVILIGGSVLSVILLAKNSESLNQFGFLAVPVSDADWSKGPEDAKAVLVEYSDLQCPACKNYYPLIKQLSDEFTEDLKFVYRHFPLSQIHKNAELAAYAAEAAGKDDKFWEMHDWLFENQDSWSKKSAQDAAREFSEFAKSLGLDGARFTASLDSEEVKKKVGEHFAGGVKAGVNSTPTFFLNGKKLVQPRSLDEFKKVINDAISKSSTPGS